MKKFIVGILFSLVAVGALAYSFDLDEFNRIEGKIRNEYILPVIIIQFISVILFSIRWRYLLDNKPTIRQVLRSSIFSVGGNMFLPARGGDVLRLYYLKKEANLTYPFLVSKAFIEKVLDLCIVLIMGAFSILLISSIATESIYSFSISFIIVGGLVGGLLIFKYFHTPILNLLDKISKFFKIQVQFRAHIKPHLIDLREYLRFRKLFIPMALSFPTWIGGYSFAYYLLGQWIGIPISYQEAIFMAFCGAIGVALPSAPSGVGLFHASIISGFVIMGRDAGEGLVYATAVHLQQFVVFGIIGAISYFRWILESRNQTSG
jgi:hypothetical protein